MGKSTMQLKSTRRSQRAL